MRSYDSEFGGCLGICLTTVHGMMSFKIMGKNICLVIHRGPDFEFKMTVNPMRKQ